MAALAAGISSKTEPTLRSIITVTVAVTVAVAVAVIKRELLR
jgi:hypothetical protein